MCILCRKKQELLSKTGQWINKGMAAGDAIMHQIEADLHQQPEDITPTRTTPTDKRPKLERSHSAAEKENMPLVRSGSMLTRQYSQQEQSTTSGRRMSASDSGVDVISPSQRQTGRVREPSVDRGQSFQQPYLEDDPRYYRSELEDLMRSQQLRLHSTGMYGSEIVHRGSVSGGVIAGSGFRNDSLSSEQSSSMDMTSCPPIATMRGSSGAPMMMVPGGNSKKHKRSGSVKKAHAHHPSSAASQQSQQQSRHHQQSQHQQSFSSSDDELRSTPECTSCEEHDSEKGEYRDCYLPCKES